MNFYVQYPVMRPYVGKDFHKVGNPSILLIGESHYLDEESPQRSSPEAWYSGGSGALSEYEITFINTARLFEDSRAEGFRKKAHSIMRNALSVINENGPRYPDYRLVADNIAFYNFFLRPAVDGGSLGAELSSQDIEIANEAFRTHFEALKPTAVVFLSSLAHNNFNPLPELSVPVIATPHPGSKWWNLAAAKYGNRRGKDILGDFIKTTNWP
jgi:hypothetical protein